MQFTEKELLRMVRAEFRRDRRLPTSGRFSKHVRTWAAITSLYDFYTVEEMQVDARYFAAQWRRVHGLRKLYARSEV